MASINLDMTGDAEKVVRALARSEREVDELKKKLREAGQASRTAGTQTSEAFGSTAAGNLKRYVTQMLSLGAAIGLAKRAMQALNEQRERAAEELKLSVPPTVQLAQLAGGDLAKLRHLISEVEATRRETGASPEEAARLQFMLESLGESAWRAFFAGFREIADPVQLAEGAATIKAAFGEAETGSIREITNKVLAASAVSKATVGEFAPAATIAAQTAATVGTTDEELLGMLAILSRALKSADVAGTQLSALADVVGRKGLGGKGILAAMPQIEQQLKGMSPQEVEEYFGLREARKGYYAVQRLQPEIAKTIAEVTRQAPAGEEDLSGRMQRSIMEVPEIEAVRKRDVAEQRALLAESEDMGVKQLNREEAVARMREQAGEGATNRMLSHWLSWSTKFQGYSPETIMGTEPVKGFMGVEGFGGEVAETIAEGFAQVFNLLTGRPTMYGGVPEVGESHIGPTTIVHGAPGEFQDQALLAQMAENQRALLEASVNLKTASNQLCDAARHMGGGTTLARPDEDR